MLRQIARQLDYHALALQLSGVLLRKRWVEPDKFISSLQSKYAKLMNETPKPWEWSYNKDRSVWQAFHVLFSELKNTNPTSAALLCLCAHYGPWTLSRDFLVLVAAITSSEGQKLVKDLELGIHLPRDEYDLLKAVDDLEDLSLVNTIRDQSRNLQQVTIRGPLLKWCMETLGQRLDWGLLACSYISASVQQAFRTAFVGALEAVPEDVFHWHAASVHHHNMRYNVAAQRCYHLIRKLSEGGLDDILSGLSTAHRKILVAFSRQYGELIYSIGHSSQDYRLGMELLAAAVDDDRQSQGTEWPRNQDSFLTWTCKTLTCLKLNENIQEAEDALASIHDTGKRKFPSEVRFLSKVQAKLACIRLRPKVDHPHQAKARLAAFERSSTDNMRAHGSVVVRSLRSYEAEYDTARQGSEPSYSRSSHSSARDYDTGASFKWGTGRLALPYFPRKFPSKNPNFFARKEALDMIIKRLSSTEINLRGDRLNTVGIFGSSGVGKTELALEYVVSQRKEYDAIFWIAADSRDRLLKEFANIAMNLQIVLPSGDQGSDHTSELCEITRSWLLDPFWTARNRLDPWKPGTPVRWLLVFDNVNDPLDLKDLWPINGKGSILMTAHDCKSRSFSNVRLFDEMHSFELSPFGVLDSGTRQESLGNSNEYEANEGLVTVTESLAERLAEQLTEQSTEQFTERTGGLPQILNQLAEILASPTLSAEEKLARLIAARSLHIDSRARRQDMNVDELSTNTLL